MPKVRTRPPAPPGETTPRAAPPLTRADTWMVALLAALTWICYAQTLGFQFVYDDKVLILHNPAILSWRSIPHYFTENFIATVFPHAPANYYRPLLLIWMLVNQKLWHFNPTGWHFAAVLVEMLAVVAFYFLARRILGDPEHQPAGAGAISGGTGPRFGELSQKNEQTLAARPAGRRPPRPRTSRTSASAGPSRSTVTPFTTRTGRAGSAPPTATSSECIPRLCRPGNTTHGPAQRTDGMGLRSWRSRAMRRSR